MHGYYGKVANTAFTIDRRIFSHKEQEIFLYEYELSSGKTILFQIFYSHFTDESHIYSFIYSFLGQL